MYSLKKCYNSLHTERKGLLPRTHSLMMGLFITLEYPPQKWLHFFLNVSVPQFSALQEPLPPMTDLLSCLTMFFKYCRQQEADSKALLCLARWHILKHHTHNLPSFFAATDSHTYTVKGVYVSFLF